MTSNKSRISLTKSEPKIKIQLLWFLPSFVIWNFPLWYTNLVQITLFSSICSWLLIITDSDSRWIGTSYIHTMKIGLLKTLFWPIKELLWLQKISSYWQTIFQIGLSNSISTSKLWTLKNRSLNNEKLTSTFKIGVRFTSYKYIASSTKTYADIMH